MAWKPKVTIQKGVFTDWCKSHGFSGPSTACVRAALAAAKKQGGAGGKSLRGRALFALRAKQGWKKTIGTAWKKAA